MASPTRPSRQPRRTRKLPPFFLAAVLMALAVTAFTLRTTRSSNPPSAVPNHVYDEAADPHQQIATALTQAQHEHKRVLLDFGGDWCGDCLVLDFYLQQPPNTSLLTRNFVLVHVFIGQMDRNLDIPAQYHVPIQKGVPALAVLDANGSLLYAQTDAQFDHMRSMDPASVTSFLERWKA